jgi:ankyrin repeat protein
VSSDEFVRAATGGRKPQAEALLSAQPEIERDPWAGLVLGRGWEGDANLPGGPRAWAPLLYVCHSVFADVGLARDLLERGADPNASFTNEYGEMSALYGAAGVVHDPELTRVLLEAGANPDDGESLYHSVEAEDPGCLRTLLEHGAATRGTNALAHALDYDRVDPVRMLLEAGADPNEGALLAHAVRRGRGPEFLELLTEHGAELDARGGETWRGDVALRTAYEHAVLRGRDDDAELLARLGASTELDPADAVVAAVARGENPDKPLPDVLDPDQQEVLVLGALDGSLKTVVDRLGLSFSGVVGGSPEGTLLHHAAWIGNAEVVRKLLDLGADATAHSPAEYSTPLAWAALASAYHELPGRDYVAVAEALLANGAEIEPRFLDVAAGPLLGWLERQRPSATG